MDSQTTQALVTQLLPLVGEFGFGGALFFIFGYTLKKVFKILAMIFVFFFGLFAVGLWYANLKGWVNISVDWTKVKTALISAVTWTMNALLQVLNTAPQQGAFFSGSAVGFLAGLKKGWPRVQLTILVAETFATIILTAARLDRHTPNTKCYLVKHSEDTIFPSLRSVRFRLKVCNQTL